MRKEAILAIIFDAIDRVSPTVGNIGRAVSGLGGPFSTIAGIASGVFDVVGKAATVVAGGIMVAFDAAKDFEQQMANVNAVLPMTKDQFSKLSDEVMRLGRETIFTAQDAALAVEALARGGATYEQIMHGAGQATLDLASATKSGMEEAARTVMSVMHQFDILPENVGHAADVIAGSVNHANMTLTDFSYALRASGTLSHEFGLSLDEISAGLAMFGQAGYVGEAAGTGLKIMLTNLVPKSKEAAKVFEATGLTINGVNQFFDQSTGKVKPLIEVFRLVQEKLGSMDTADKVQAMKQMFGQRSAVMGELLVGMREGGAGYEEFLKILSNTSAGDIAQKRLDSLAGSQERLKGEWETASIVFGQAFLPIVRRFTDWAEGALSAAQPLIKIFSEWLGMGLERLPETLAKIAGISLDAVAPGLRPLTDFLTNLAGIKGMGDKKMLGAFDIDTTPAMATLEGFGSAVREVIKNIFGEGAAEGFDQVVGSLQGIAKWVTDPATIQGAKDLAAGIGQVMQWIVSPEGQSSIKSFADGLAVLAGIIVQIVSFLGGENAFGGLQKANETFSQLGYIFQNLGPAISEALSQIGQKIGEQVALWVSEFQTRLTEISTNVSTKWEEIKTSITTKLAEIYDGIKGKLAEWLAEIVAKGEAIRLDVQTKWDAILTKINEVLNQIWTDIKGKWDAILREISDKLKAILGDVQKKWDEIYEKISTKLAAILEGIKTKFAEMRDKAFALMGELKDKVLEKAGQLVTDIAEKWKQMISDVQTWWRDLKEKAVAWIESLKTAAVEKAGQIVTDLLAKWKQLVTDVQTWWGELKTKAHDAIQAIIDAIPGWATELLNKAKELGTGFIDGLKQGITDAWTSFVQWVKDKIIGAIGAILPGGGGGPKTGFGFDPLGAALAMSLGAGFMGQMATTQSMMTSSVQKATEHIIGVTEDQLAMLKKPWEEFDVDKYRALRKLGMDMGRTGKGGFVAASRRNYYDVWRQRNNTRFVGPTDADWPAPPPGPGGSHLPVPAAQQQAAPQQIYATFVLEVGGLEIGRWNKVTAPDLGRRADRHNMT